MIVLDLSCAQGHAFEGWFASAAAFEDQLARALVSCPQCGSHEIHRKLSAPYVNTRRGAPEPAAPSKPSSPPPVPVQQAAPAPSMADIEAMLKATLRAASRQCVDVGSQFADEARRIHYGESEARGIRGQASRDELEALIDEGISVFPVPPDDAESH